MAGSGGIADFAAYLRELKDRTGRSYGVLAGRLHVSTSTLYRYCNGDAVPADYAPVERFARLCGATPEELVRLHRLWIVADAERASGRGGGARNGRAAAPFGNAGDDDPAATDAGSAVPPVAGQPSTVPRNGRAASAADPGAAAVGSTAGQSEEGPAAADTAEPPDTAPDGGGSGDGSGDGGAGGADDEDRDTNGNGDGGALPSLLRRPPKRAWAAIAGAVAALMISVAAVELSDNGGGSGDDGWSGGEARASAPSSSQGSGKPSRSPGDSPSDGSAGGSRDGGEEKSGPGGGSGGDAGGQGKGRKDGGNGGGNGSGGASATRSAPFSLTTRSHVWESGCAHRYLIGKPASRVPPPPVEQDAPTWADAQGAVHGGSTIVEATVQGSSEESVVLQALHVRVVGRLTPLKWSSFAMDNGCGGALTPARFTVNLDAARPVPHPTDGFDGESSKVLPAVRLPYEISSRDPLVINVSAGTEDCYCRWYLELDWTSKGREGTTRIDDGGEPFRTSSVKGRPAYSYWLENRRWTKEE